MIEKDKKVVAVGMSGGVYSASTMAALMLKQEGPKDERWGNVKCSICRG